MSDPLYCSFCGKANTAVLVLIAGPTVFICDECVEACRDMVGWQREQRRRNGVIDVFRPSRRDSNRSGGAGETQSGSTEGESAGLKGIAQTQQSGDKSHDQ